MVLEQRYSNKTIDYSFYNFSYGEEPGKVNAIGICRGDIEAEDCQIYSNKTIDYGFYNSSYGEEADKVNAIGICRGDTVPEDCRGFLEASATLLSKRCGIRKEAIGYFNSCMLHYSNESIFGVMTMETSKYFNIEAKLVAIADDVFNKTRDDLFCWMNLKHGHTEGDSRKKFAEKSVKVMDESGSRSDTIDTFMVWFGSRSDLSKQDCSVCLDSAFRELTSWCMKGCLYLDQAVHLDTT